MLFVGHRFRTDPDELDALWARLPGDLEQVEVVMEPTRNAWVALAAWFRRRGAKVVLVPPEQSADLRDYYNKHTKTDRLDSKVLARLPLLHPEGLHREDALGPGDHLKRAVKIRSGLVHRRTAAMARLDALLEILGPAWIAALGSDMTLTALRFLARYANPVQVKRLGKARLAAFFRRSSPPGVGRRTRRRGHRSRRDHAPAVGTRRRRARLRRARRRHRRRSPARADPHRGDQPARQAHCRTLRQGRPGRDRPIRPRRRPGLRPADPRTTRRRNTIRQPRRDPLLRRPGPRRRLLRPGRRPRRTHQGRRRLPARSRLHRRRPRPQDRPHPRRPLPPAHARRQAPRLRRLHAGRGPAHPYRGLPAQRRALRAARHRRPRHHRSPRTRHCRRTLHRANRSPRRQAQDHPPPASTTKRAERAGPRQESPSAPRHRPFHNQHESHTGFVATLDIG